MLFFRKSAENYLRLQYLFLQPLKKTKLFPYLMTQLILNFFSLSFQVNLTKVDEAKGR